ncbi:MAG: asparagine synthase (glutamine-hydrolyzing) [Elusimicrobia bacterium]|nr:asparagine synthase (glutamine-hydrolyzing) [Candidatus Obscuribacterium magneticum]
MCGIAGILNFQKKSYSNLSSHLSVMNDLQAHRGPDGEGMWVHKRGFAGFGHRRLSIIDLQTGSQPMSDSYGNTICYNGEIYNYLELKAELNDYPYQTTSDTEVILASYRKWGVECVNHFRGMFAFALWDESKQALFCARDRFGIKPFYFTQINDTFYFASEAKALLPFLPAIETDVDALKDYLVFQICLDGKTLFKGIRELLPAHRLIIKNQQMKTERYWDVYYHLDFEHPESYFHEKLVSLFDDSVKIHTRSDVPIGSSLSGGIDSSLVAGQASRVITEGEFMGFIGKFDLGDMYDESHYARELAEMYHFALHEITITSQNFIDTISKVIYHLDYPVAGPGSFPQYHVSKLASQFRKVVLGGQGGDEIFGGYTRYLLAYFEQCIKAAIDGTMNNGNFIVTYESIIPNLQALRNYRPLIQEFWREGLFEDLDKRYYRLINRAPTLEKEIRWGELGRYSPFETFKKIFHGDNVKKESYFDSMTHFDFKTLLPALLQVEDRMGMAHGLESRVPFLDHPLVEFAATMPSNIKFKNGTLKMSLINAMGHRLPLSIRQRKDKMGFPVPLNEWVGSDLKDYIYDIFTSQKAKERPFINNREVLNNLHRELKFGRKLWGLLSLELWQQEFHDKQSHFKNMIKERSVLT